MLVSKAFAGWTDRGVRCNLSFRGKNHRGISVGRAYSLRVTATMKGAGAGVCVIAVSQGYAEHSIAIEMKIAFRQSDFIGPS